MSQWRKLEDILSGYDLKWKKYPLEGRYKEQINKKPGVYVLCSHPPECEKIFSANSRLNIFNVMYVGKAENLHKRFKHYVNSRNLSPKVKKFVSDQRKKAHEVTFGYAFCSVSVLKQVEGMLIDCFGPSANAKRENVGPSMQGKSGDGIEL